MKRNSSFTLIEILVVSAIIGLLSVGGIVSFSQLGKQSRDSRRKADIEQVRAALESYRSDDVNSSYPASINDLISLNYLKSIPTDPKTQASYITYTPTCPSICTTYILRGNLESGGAYQTDPYGGSTVTIAPTSSPD